MRSVFLALAAAAPCCESCPSGTDKYWSLAPLFENCAETCLTPSEAKAYKVIVPGMKKAEIPTPCADADFPTYHDTQTQGVGPVKVTIDLYKAKPAPKCCTSCEVPQVKYYSIDTKHNMCGESCITPDTFWLYKRFEPGLENAEGNTPCADRNYTAYDSTPTHGVGPIKATVDLYGPTAGSLAAVAKPRCPGSKAWLHHASCELTATFEESCATVKAEVEARIAGKNGWVDPHNHGTYSVTGGDATSLEVDRTTGDGKYTDKMVLTFAASGGCVVSACSESQVTSYLDFSTNYCNLHDLWAGSQDQLPHSLTDLKYTEAVGTCSQAEKSACHGKATLSQLV